MDDERSMTFPAAFWFNKYMCPYLFSDSRSQTFIPYMDSHINQHCFKGILSYCRTRAKKSGNGEEKIRWGEIPFLQKGIICCMTLDLASKLKCWNLTSQMINCPFLKHTVKLLNPIRIRTLSSKTYLNSLASSVDANDTLWYMHLALEMFVYPFYSTVVFGPSLEENKEPLIPSA